MWYAYIMTTQQSEEADFFPATTADWHRHWHFENPEIPGACPWDCGAGEIYDEWDEPGWFVVKCGHCKMYHGAPDWDEMRRTIRECSKKS